jgi:flotillin
LFSFLAMGFHTCGPNGALVKTGAFVKKPVIVSGGYVYTIPCVQQVQFLDLRVMTLDIHSPHVYTKQGVPITVRSIAQIKISRYACAAATAAAAPVGGRSCLCAHTWGFLSKPDALEIAAGQFLGLPREQVMKAADETLEGHQRAILGTMTVEEVFQDREKFASEVLQTAAVDIANMGLEIVSFTIRDVSDPNGYLASLGLKRTAEVKRDARIGEAEAERDAGVREAQANREKMAKRAEADTAIADSLRKFQLQQAQFETEVNTERARAEMAGDLQRAKTKQEIKRETMEVEVVVRRKRIEVEEQEILRKAKELEATVKKPAAAERCARSLPGAAAASKCSRGCRAGQQVPDGAAGRGPARGQDCGGRGRGQGGRAQGRGRGRGHPHVRSLSYPTYRARPSMVLV